MSGLILPGHSFATWSCALTARFIYRYSEKRTSKAWSERQMYRQTRKNLCARARSSLIGQLTGLVTSPYKSRSCLLPYLLGKSPIRYCKTALKLSPKACALHRRVRNRTQATPNSIAGYTRKQCEVATFDGSIPGKKFKIYLSLTFTGIARVLNRAGVSV